MTIDKFALLIGVSEYESSKLSELPAVEEDVEKMERVLLNPEMCGFKQENLQRLINPDMETMRRAISWLFNLRKKDDLVLLYLACHGIHHRDSGRLYFAASTTREDDLIATGVEARYVHDVMADSRSRRQVIILDCCYSGAFSNGMLARSPEDINVKVDIQQHLGGEGRAVLTSSTSLQPTLDGVYTTYLVQGIETGAADEDGNGRISIRELHNYTKNQVQIYAPSMEPEIYTTKEGYEIIFSQAPIGDPRLEYRKKLNELVHITNGEISDRVRRTLDQFKRRLGLTDEEAKNIEDSFFEPFRQRQDNLNSYEEEFRQAVQNQYPLSDSDCKLIKMFQQSLGLRDEDVQAIEERIVGQYTQNLQNYEQNFRQLLQNGHPLHKIRHEQLQQASALREEKLHEIEHRVLEERQQQQRQYEQALRQAIQRGFIIFNLFKSSPNLRDIAPSSILSDNDIQTIYNHLKRQFLSRYLPIAILPALALGIFLGLNSDKIDQPQPNPTPSNPKQQSNSDVGSKISLGEKSLFPDEFYFNEENEKRIKKAGIDKFKSTQIKAVQNKRDYEQASEIFKDYLDKFRNDAEALIFKNNAMALAQGNPLKIAVSVPISASLNVAMEILRGVAQAQEEFNSNTSGKKLLVIIGDDGNDKTVAGITAKEFLKHDILAVIGSNNINASMGAAEAYQLENQRIVMISPTAFGEGLGNFTNAKQMIGSNYIKKVATVLGNEIETLQTPSGKINLLICSHEGSQDNNKFISEFEKINFQRIKINKKCSLNDANLNISNILESAVNKPNAILLAPHINEEEFQKAIEVATQVAQANQNLPPNERLKLFGSPTMNAAYIGKQGAEAHRAFGGMKVAVPWNPYNGEGQKFLNYANCRLWKGHVNWRTAMAYTATKAITTILKSNPNPSEDTILNEITKPEFNFNGATGNVNFSQNQEFPVSIVEFEYKQGNSGFTPREICREQNTTLKRSESPFG